MPSSWFPPAGRALVAAALCAVVTSGCGGDPEPLADSLTPVQIAGLDRAWSQRITALSAPADTATAAASDLYRACAAMELSSTFLQAMKTTCAPTAVSVKLAVVIPERCERPTRRCINALDRAKAANDTMTDALLQLSESAKTISSDERCLAQFTVDPVQEQRYRDLSAAFDALALGAERRDDDIMALGRRRIEEAQAAIKSRLSTPEQIARFRQACGIDDRV